MEKVFIRSDEAFYEYCKKNCIGDIQRKYYSQWCDISGGKKCEFGFESDGEWVKVERANVTKQEYVDNDLTKYIGWYNDYGDDERGYRGHYILDVREADTNLENIDLDCYLLVSISRK